MTACRSLEVSMTPDSRTCVTCVLVAIMGIANGGCGDGGGGGRDAGYVVDRAAGADMDTGPLSYPDGGVGAVLSRASRSSAIDITEDDQRVVMVNPEDDSLSIFTTADNRHVGTVATGDQPSSVVLHPDGRTAFVANQG